MNLSTRPNVCNSHVTKCLAEISAIKATSKKVKVAHTWLPSIGFWSWTRFLAVRLQVTGVINPAVGCNYFARPAVTPTTLKRAATNFAAWWTEAGWVWAVCLSFFIRQRCGCDLNPGLFCAWVQHANHSATEPPSSSLVIIRRQSCQWAGIDTMWCG